MPPDFSPSAGAAASSPINSIVCAASLGSFRIICLPITKFELLLRQTSSMRHPPKSATIIVKQKRFRFYQQLRLKSRPVRKAARRALADPAVNAVVMASSTDTHAELVEAAARGGKA